MATQSAVAVIGGGSSVRRPTNLNNGVAVVGGSVAAEFINAVKFASAAWVASTLQTVVTRTGRGQLDFVGLRHGSAASRSARIKITVDGTVVYDKTQSNGGSFNLIAAVGGIQFCTDGASNWFNATFQPLFYSSSLLIEASSSLGEVAGNMLVYTNDTTHV